MSRVALATAWVWFALAEPAWAFAPALEPGELGSIVGMCGDRPELGSSTPTPPTPIAKPNERERDDETAAAKPAPSERAQNSLAQGLLPPLEDSPIAWCLSPDDPRCAPRESGAPTGPLFGQPQLNPSGNLVRPDVRVIEVQSVSRFWQLGAARPGIHSRIERPPR